MSPPTGPNPDTMDIDTGPTATTTTTTVPATTTTSTKKQRTNPRPPPTTLTLRAPPFAYAHLTLAPPTTTTTTTTTPDPSDPLSEPAPPLLDNLQVRSYLTAALRQFLGDTGAAIPVDILLIRGASVWVRVPREDLAAFAAGVTAFGGVSAGSAGVRDGDVGGRVLLQLGACGDWLGSLIGREEEAGLWTG